MTAGCTEPRACAGVVLAGGGSIRMERDKACSSTADVPCSITCWMCCMQPASHRVWSADRIRVASVYPMRTRDAVR